MLCSAKCDPKRAFCVKWPKRNLLENEPLSQLKDESTMRSRSRSFNDVEEFIDELNWSEEILTKNIDEGDLNTISRARQCIRRRVRLLDSIRTSCRNINADIGKTFAKITNRTDTGLTLASSIKFPIEAFTVDNSDEFCNPNIFHEVYPMAYISACKTNESIQMIIHVLFPCSPRMELLNF